MATRLTEGDTPADTMAGVMITQFYGGHEHEMCYEFKTEDGSVVISAKAIRELVKGQQVFESSSAHVDLVMDRRPPFMS